MFEVSKLHHVSNDSDFSCSVNTVLVSTVGPKLLTYVTKVITQCLQLLFVLLRMELQSHLLMQVCYSINIWIKCIDCLFFIVYFNSCSLSLCLYPRILLVCPVSQWPGLCASCVAAD